MNPQFEQLLKNRIDYDNVKDMCEIHISNHDVVDISFIIPVKNRIEFGPTIYKSFIAAKENTDLKISYTMVEISHKSDHKEFCIENGINYIWYKTGEKEIFNKCLGMNMGAFFSNKSKAFLFHDIDCLIQSDFFVKLEENINKKNAKAIQCFHGRRVLYLNQTLTDQAITDKLDIDSLKLGVDGVTTPRNIGAPGGSIYVNKDTFFKVGGFDPEFFAGNAPEDAFFWYKVDLVSKMHVSDDPEIDIFHMNHPKTAGTNPHLQQMLEIYNSFKELSNDDKNEIIDVKSKFISEYE